MLSRHIDLSTISPEKESELKRLIAIESISWPTVILAGGLLAIAAVVYAAGFAGWLPLWLGCTLNSIVGYYSFSVIHDAIHRSAAKDNKLNDAIGYVGLLPLIPYVHLGLFRWAHILHHRFANEAGDPDSFFHGPTWSLPFRWMFIDVHYLFFSLKNQTKVSRKYFHATLRRLALFLVLLGALAVSGYTTEVVLLWLIPSRIMFLLMGFSFFWLPHVPHEVTQKENFTRATTIRKGWEGLLNIALQYQNYHLIHHLFPMTPFYNNYKVYKLIESDLDRYELAIQKNMHINPDIKTGEIVQA